MSDKMSDVKDFKILNIRCKRFLKKKDVKDFF